MQNVIKQYSSTQRKYKRSMEWSDHSSDWLRIKREHCLCDNQIFFHSHFIEQNSLSNFSVSLIQSLTNKTGSEVKGTSSRCLLDNSYGPLQTSSSSTHKTVFVPLPGVMGYWSTALEPDLATEQCHCLVLDWTLTPVGPPASTRKTYGK